MMQKSNIPLSAKQMLVITAIPTGRNHAIKVQDLSDRTGLTGRMVKQVINELRALGYPLVSSCNGGYFYPNPEDEEDVQEAERFFRMQYTQAISRFESAKPIKAWLKNIGQLTFDELNLDLVRQNGEA